MKISVREGERYFILMYTFLELLNPFFLMPVDCIHSLCSQTSVLLLHSEANQSNNKHTKFHHEAVPLMALIDIAEESKAPFHHHVISNDNNYAM